MALDNFGERFVPYDENKTQVEHLHRYSFAKDLIDDLIVLDIASGEGYGSHILSEKAKFVYGIDVSTEAVNHSIQKYQKKNLKFLVGSTSNIPLSDNSIDVIVSFETIEHHNEHEKMILEFKRILKQNGILIISSPDKMYYSDLVNYKNPHHIKELYKEEFLSLINVYFKKTILLNQGIIKGSIIYSENNNIDSSINFYSGKITSILRKINITIPDYNIIIASDTEIPQINQSFFETELFDNEISRLAFEIDELKNSKSFKIGNIIAMPFRFFLRILKINNVKKQSNQP